MGRLRYRIDGKRLLIDKTMYESISNLGIPISEIEARVRHLQSIGHPKATSYTACSDLVKEYLERRGR